MAFVIADRVAETTTTTGTGTLNLAGPSTGFQSFVAGVGDGNTCFYVITDNTDWEVGIGTVTSATPDTLSRDNVLQSTNSDAAVNWGAGTKDVFLSVPADRTPTLNADNTFTGVNTFSGDVVLPNGVIDFANVQDLTDYTVMGNVSGADAAPAEVSILDEDDMTSDSETALATQQSIKAYVDSGLSAVGLTMYTSGLLTVNVNDDHTLTHGLGAKPDFYDFRLINQTAEYGFSIGDEYILPTTTDAGSGRAFSAYLPNDTNIEIRLGASAMPIIDANNVARNITTANWRLVVRAFKI